MKCSITASSDYLRAEVVDRRSAEETLRYLDWLRTEVARSQVRKVIICLRSSVALFKMEKFHLSEFLDFAKASRLRIALASDSTELHLSHQYVEVLARAKGVDLKAFGTEEEALGWLMHKTDFSVAQSVSG